MSISSLDRCPRCGSPYMSAMLPNETAATRYCYTCATAAGSLKLQLDANAGTAPQSDPDDLELQPADETSSSSGKPRGRIPQIAPSRGSARQVRPPTAIPNIRPSGRGSSRAALPVPPSNTIGSSASTPAPVSASGSRNRISSPKFEIPQIAPRAEDFQPEKQSVAFPMKIAVGLCACVLVAVAAIYATKGSKETPPADTSLARATPQPSTAPKTAVEVPNISPPKAQAPSEKKIATKTVSPIEDTGSRIGLAGMTDPKGPPAGPVILAPTEDIKPTPKPATATEINDIIGKPRTKKAAGGDEEEAPLVIAEKPKAVEKPVEPAAETKPVAPDAPPEKADKADDDEDLGKDGKPKKPKRSLLDNLGGDAPQPVKHEIEKKEKENPFAIKTVPVTATEPTIMPLDIEKVSGNDRTLTEQLIVFLPNWRVRDVNYNTTTKIGDKHQGRDNVIVLNPLNDVLPAKLMATIEIPKNFAGAHPTVLFEISSAVNGKDWALSVKAMGVDMFPRTKVKLPKDAPWHEVAIDLSQLADKHFDFQIEVNATGKHPKGTASEIGYIRNVRFEWTGKKK